MKAIEPLKELHQMIMVAMTKSPELYSLGDKKWIGDNIQLVNLFFKTANLDRLDSKRRHRSQRTIIRHLRENTYAHDNSRQFKIMNSCVALLAHVYNDCLSEPYFKVNARKAFDLSGTPS